MKKLRIVWICHFSNSEVRKYLPLTKRGQKTSDFAQWVTNTINEFISIKDIELHIISPQYGLKTMTYSFDFEGIHYHFYTADIPFINKVWPPFFPFDKLTSYIGNRILVRKLLKKIKPDLINLWGSENPYYSSTVLGIKNVPVLITIQGIYSNPERFKVVHEDKLRSKLERRIHSQNKYFGVSAPFMPSLIARDSKTPILFWTEVAKKINIPIDLPTNKSYDFVLFSRLSVLKGCFDALEALAIVKKTKNNITFRMMGVPGSETIMDELKAKVNSLGLENNVILSGSFDLHEDLIKEAAKAKYYILPTKLDTIPGTIFEAIYLGLPVVSYKTGDIPLLNKGDIRVLLSENGDITALAENMLRLINEPLLSIVLCEKAKIFVEKWFNSRVLAFNFIDQYKAVIDNYYNNSIVPDKLLYENFMKND